jgi:hypothetical protein
MTLIKEERLSLSVASSRTLAYRNAACVRIDMLHANKFKPGTDRFCDGCQAPIHSTNPP